MDRVEFANSGRLILSYFRTVTLPLGSSFLLARSVRVAA